MKPRIAVTRAIFPELLAPLQAQYDVLDNQADVPRTTADLQAAFAGRVGALVTPTDRIDAAALEGAADLRCLATISVGYNHIDLDACTQRGILVTNTPDVLTETTADMAWALLLAAARRVAETEAWLRAGQWNRWAIDLLLGVDVHHSRLGIVGMGRIGQAIARRAAGFGMEVVYFNRSRLPATIEAECRATRVPFDTLLETADHVMLVVPYAPENHHMIGAAQLARMKPTATLVNIARGGLIDEDALAAALQAGRLFAAGLDVYEGEPVVNPALLACRNVVLTPHLGSASRATRLAMVGLAIANLSAALAGQRPPNLLNPQVLDRG